MIMKHYSLEEWADFARRRTSGESAAEMQSHLDEGCAACAEVSGLWSSVLEVASRETGLEAPESGVGYAKSIYAIAGPPKADSLPVRFARLVFSSFAEPLREGIRSSEASTCHLLFEEGNWLLDVHLKPHAERRLVSVAGQILERSLSAPAYDGHSVAVLCEKVELARGTTNEFGEFQLEFSPRDHMMLTVNLKGESLMVSALPAYTGAKG
jgi:hypothetical protein